MNGFEKNVGIMSKKPKGVIGKVIKVVNESENIEISENFEVKKEISRIENSFDTGIRIFMNTVEHNFRLSFQRLCNKIDYNTWLQYSTRQNKAKNKMFYEKMLKIFKSKIRDYFFVFTRKLSTKSLNGIRIMVATLEKYHKKQEFFNLLKRCKVISPLQKSRVKCGLLLLTITNSKVFSRLKSSVFITFLRKKTQKTKTEALCFTFTKIMKLKLAIHYNQIFNYFDIIKQNAVKNLALILIKKDEKNRFLGLIKYFFIFKACSSSNNSEDSKKSSDVTQRPKYNLKIISALDDSDNAKTVDFLNSPTEKNIFDEHSPRGASKKMSFSKPKLRTLSKQSATEKNKLKEKNKSLKKFTSYADEIKARQQKNKFLRIGSAKSKDNEGEKSPVYTPKTQNPTEYVKLQIAFKIIEDKVKLKYYQFLSLLKLKKSEFFSTNSSEHFEKLGKFEKLEKSPIFSETWKYRLYNLGINKLTALTKRRLKLNVLNRLFY